MNPSNPRFEAIVMPHLDAAYNLARWLVRDPHAAEDIVQEAFLRAFRYFGSFRGDDARPWVLGIVRNAAYTWLEAAKRSPAQLELDENIELDDLLETAMWTEPAESPETLLLRKAERTAVNAAIRSLPTSFREVIILREIEDLPYDGIAAIMQIPVGTVMSRLSRARGMLRNALESTLGARAYET